MKPILSLIAFLIIISSCLQKKDQGIPGKLKGFYTNYISIMDTMSVDRQFSTDTLQKYCTASFLKKIPAYSDSCDCDPIIRGQDYDREWAKTLTVALLIDGQEKKYNICFREADSAKHCLLVTVTKENGEWKIDDVEDKSN